MSFTAIDDYLSGGPKVYHEPDAVQNRSIKFWYMPRVGSYACAPFLDFEGNVKESKHAFTVLHRQKSTFYAEMHTLDGSGVPPGISTELLRGCPRIRALVEHIEAHPKVAEWNRRPTTPPIFEDGEQRKTVSAF